MQIMKTVDISGPKYLVREMGIYLVCSMFENVYVKTPKTPGVAPHPLINLGVPDDIADTAHEVSRASRVGKGLDYLPDTDGPPIHGTRKGNGNKTRYFTQWNSLIKV